MMLYTPRLHIRRFRTEDLDALFGLLSDESVMKHLEPPYTKEQTRDFLYRFGVSPSPLVYAVEDQNSRFVGYVIYHPYDPDSREIGWVLAKDQWGKGYAAELTQYLIEDAKGKTSRLIIECTPSQTATKRIAKKHRFSFLENRDGLDIYVRHLSSNQ